MTLEPDIELLSDEQTRAYLQRIGLGEPRPASAQWLRELQFQHLHNVSFENLSIHLDEPISLVIADLFDKIVRRGRGGFCYELNGLFGSLLRTLGFDVQLLSAAVYGSSGLGPPFDHLALSVAAPADDHRWLTDVGFGRHSMYPLRMDASDDQTDPHGSFRLTTTSDGDIDVRGNDALLYRVESRPRALVDFAPTCWWQQTWPGSHFRSGPVCSRLSDSGGWITLAGRRLVVTENGERTETTLLTDSDVLAAYRRYFGLNLDRVPAEHGAS